MEVSKQAPSMELAVVTTPYQDLLQAQKDLFESQIEKLQNVVALQCKLTGVNPLSQEMAAGALSIKIGKRPRDLLNPKAVKYMQSVFCIKDGISKKETREISARFGVTVTQVRDFFTGQRTRVRKFVRLSREKADRSAACDAMHDVVASTSDLNMPAEPPAEPLPLDTIAPANIEEAPSCMRQHEFLSGMGDSDRHFVENIFILMRKEESFFGQVKLLQWVLRVGNPSVLKWFLTEGGVMILATWLSQAAAEEQSSVLHVILKVLSYLPLREALPFHISAILQSVNRLRFYRKQDISHRARILLSKWSKMFDKSQALKKSRGVQSAGAAHEEMLLKQSIDEVMGNDSWDPKYESSESMKFLCDNPDNIKKLDTSQPLKLLMAPGDESNKRRGVLPSHTRERRKVQLVEHPGQKLAIRSPQIAKSTPVTQSRPLSADDIQKAKMRAQFKQSKFGKAITISDDHLKPESQNRCSTSSQVTEPIALPPVSKSVVQHEVEEDSVLEPPLKKYKRIEIPWRIPPELKIPETWSVATGSSSKEVEVQKNRIKREKQAIYREIQQIPSNPNEPWDREMGYDDSLTPQIPIEQLPDETFETPPIPANSDNLATFESTSSGNNNNSNSMPEPDLELLAELLKNPDLVFALTSGNRGELSNEETVKLLDMIKANSLGGRSGQNNVEVSLPSPTPSNDVVPNGLRPDFSRNPFSRQPINTASNVHRTSATFMQHQTQLGSVLAAQAQPLAHLTPVSSFQTHIQSEQWQQQISTNIPIHSNPSNTQHFTQQMMLNANIDNRAPPTIRAESLVQYPVSPQLPYLQGRTESTHHYQNNPNLNNYNVYAGGPAWGGNNRNNVRERTEFESWSPDNSPSNRHYEHNGQRMNLRQHGYGQNSGYQEHGMRGAGNKRWRDYRR